MSVTVTEEKVWERVLIARDAKRPTAQNLIRYLLTDFIELHGDRYYADDHCLVGGIGYLGSLPVTVISQEKGSNTKEKIERNFGMPNPEGYRKALRLMKQAEKFGRPIVSIIDTPGAYPGVGAEERGQANAIAMNLAAMSEIRVPIISVVLGEGGSGGALAIGESDEIWMFENAIYSILSPEGFASILYKDAAKAKQAASIMKLTAQDLFHYGIVEKIIPEAEGGLQNNPEYSFRILKQELTEKLAQLLLVSENERLSRRYRKYRKIGAYEEL